jgi:hypothetical protein
MSSSPSQTATRRKSWVRRWLFRVSLLLLAGALLAGGWYAFHRYQQNAKLQEVLVALDRAEPGWRWKDIQAARSEIPDDRNGALCAVRATKLLPDDWPGADAKDVVLHLDPPMRLRAEKAASLRKALERAQSSLREARNLSNLPNGRYRIAYDRNPQKNDFHDLERLRFLIQLLQCDSAALAEQGEDALALGSCGACLNAARSVGDEPIFIPQLIRIAGVAIACKATERVLAQSEPPVAELEALQKAFEREDCDPGFLLALRGERAIHQVLFEAFDDGEISVDELGEGGPARNLEEHYWSWWVLDKLREERPLMLSETTKRIAIAQLPEEEQPAAERQWIAKINALSTQAIFTHMFAPAVNLVGEAFRRKHALLRSAATAIAVERYHRDHGVWPDGLDPLPKVYLSEVPTDPYNGKPIRFRRTAFGVVVYSVGPDGTDDGGLIDDADMTRAGTDIGIRLWDPDNRRQPPAP